MNYAIPVLLFAVMYFLLIRPQQQRVRRQQALVNSIDVGDEIVTAGGIIGTVTALDDEEATVEIASGVEIRLLRYRIAGLVRTTGDDDDGDNTADTGDEIDSESHILEDGE